MSHHKTEKTGPGNIDQTLAFLKHAFNRATMSLGYKNHKGTRLYDYQCEFMWVIHDITNGPIFSISHFVQQANNLIKDIEEEIKRDREKSKGKSKEK